MRLGLLKFWGLIGVAVLVPIVLYPSFSQGQEYPTQTVQIIGCWPPGGFTTILAPMVSEEAKKYLSKPVITVFKPGAAGTIGAYYVAKSPPDGYTLLMGTVGHIVVAPFIQKLDYTPQDFEIMGQIALNPFTFCVRADAPWQNLKELVAYAKKNPGVVTCGNSGTYTAMHLTAMRFEQVAGIKLTHVPFKGGADSMTNVAGGHASMGIRVLGEGEPLVDAGKVRVLSILDSKRCKFYPDVPTTKEEGFAVEAGAWAVLMAPKGTPKRILTTWENIINQITHDKSFIEKADKLKMNIEFKSAEDFQKYYQEKINEYGEMIKKMGLKPS